MSNREVIFTPDVEAKTSWREMRSTIRCTVCSSYLTLLAYPDSAGGGLGRARVVSRRGVLLSFFSNQWFGSQVYIRTYRYIVV